MCCRARRRVGVSRLPGRRDVRNREPFHAHYRCQNRSVDCSVVREALSARLDGEPDDVPSAEVDAHIEHCAECRRWYTAAAELTRRTRIGLAPRAPDLTVRILEAFDDRSQPSVAGATETNTTPPAAPTRVPRGAQ